MWLNNWRMLKKWPAFNRVFLLLGVLAILLVFPSFLVFSAPPVQGSKASSTAKKEARPRTIKTPRDTKGKEEEVSEDIIVEKNLFSEERRYIPEDQGTSSKGRPRQRKFLLYGVYRVGGKAKALIKVSQNVADKMGLKVDSRGYLTVSKGDSLGPYTVEEIKGRKVVLKGEGGTLTLDLVTPKGGKGPINRPASIITTSTVASRVSPPHPSILPKRTPGTTIRRGRVTTSHGPVRVSRPHSYPSKTNRRPTPIARLPSKAPRPISTSRYRR